MLVGVLFPAAHLRVLLEGGEVQRVLHLVVGDVAVDAGGGQQRPHRLHVPAAGGATQSRRPK
eukprot:7713646-Pyramimonas_sp.AAC.1